MIKIQQQLYKLHSLFFYYNNRNYNHNINKFKLSPKLKMKYKINIINKNKLEFLFIVRDLEINKILFEDIYYCLIQSQITQPQFQFTLMTGLNQGDWLSIGRSFILNSNVKVEDFVNHYLESYKILKDKHYEVYEFDILMSKVININNKYNK